MKNNYLLIVTLFSVSSQLQLARAVEPTAAMGKELFEQPGSNSCSFCHGIDGNGGKVANAAKLSTPKAWRTYKALGGDAAFSKNKAAFVKDFESAIVDLIAKGAILHNMTFKKGDPVNAQMMGLGGSPSMAWLNKKKDAGVTKDIAARSAFLHVKSFDTQSIFK